MKKAGAETLGNGLCRFNVWAPRKDEMILHITYPRERRISMTRDNDGCFSALEDAQDGCRYLYMPDGVKDFPDPASHYQPEGVHGPSQVVDHGKFKWHDALWKGVPLREMIFYEIHTGTFTKEGTFDAIIPFLDHLAFTGINAIELMPVSQFPGKRNWGYDGVFPYSVQDSYGGPDGLKRLVDACHGKGIAVFLDMVYNHVGPEGNYFQQFAPYFSGKYRVPSGDAINYDDEWSDGVREYFSQNVIHWFGNYHLDGLRVDAIHMMFDSGATNFWELTYDKVRYAEEKQGRRFYLIAESDFNSPKVVKHPEEGGFGFDAQWLDDFHHALYVLLHPEGKSRYEDFGTMEQLAKAFRDGFVHSGEYVIFRKRKHGASSSGLPGYRFVAFNQNHDQVGNRPEGERLSALVGQRELMMASAVLLLSPYIPLLFMGEEYGEDNPFFYFVSHTDKALADAVREGRKKEFAGYRWTTEPPDPQDEDTFQRSVIDFDKRLTGRYRILLDWNRTLIMLRKSNLALQNFSKDGIDIIAPAEKALVLHRKSEDGREHVIAFFCFSDEKLQFNVPSAAGKWEKILDSNEWLAVRDKEAVPSPDRLVAGELFYAGAWSVIVYSNKRQDIYE